MEEAGSQTPFVSELLARQTEVQAAREFSMTLRQETEQLLTDKGVTRMKIFDRSMNYLMLGSLALTLGAWASGIDLREYSRVVYLAGAFSILTSPLLVGKLFPLRRFFETSQTRYITEQLDEGTHSLTAFITSNDGDAHKANEFQIGLLPLTEFMVLRGEEGNIACTENDPRFKIIDPMQGIRGRRFDHTEFKFVRPATTEDAANYLQLVRSLATQN